MTWLDAAACRTSPDPDLWFDDGVTTGSAVRRRQAVEICRRCPSQAACAAHALTASPQVAGIWGGLTELQRARRRRRAE